jgi:hypothetical protein
LNDPVNLKFYTQIIRFQLSPKEEEVVFQGLDLVQRKVIERWAESLGLVLEWDGGGGSVKVFKIKVHEDDLDITRRINSGPLDDSNVSDVSTTDGLGAGHSAAAPLRKQEKRDSSTQTDHIGASGEERALAGKAGDEDGTLGDNSRGETTPLFSPGGTGEEKVTNRISDGATEIPGLQTDAKSSQDPSYMLSIGPSTGIGSPQIAAPTKTEIANNAYSVTENLSVSSNVNPTICVPLQNTPGPTSLTPNLYSPPIPTPNFTDGSHFPGPLLWAPTQPIFPPPTKDPEEQLRLDEEKRTRNAGASARFRYNRKLKVKAVEALEQNVADLERRLREMEAEKEFCRLERDRFRDVVLRIPRLRYLAVPSSRL